MCGLQATCVPQDQQRRLARRVPLQDTFCSYPCNGEWELEASCFLHTLAIVGRVVMEPALQVASAALPSMVRVHGKQDSSCPPLPLWGAQQRHLTMELAFQNTSATTQCNGERGKAEQGESCECSQCWRLCGPQIKIDCH